MPLFNFNSMLTSLAFFRLTRYCRNIFLILLVGLFAGCASVQPLPPSATPAERQTYLASQIDHLLDSKLSSSEPGISVMIFKNGKPLYSRGRGMADINRWTPITTDTSFAIASISKPITAVAVMQLVERRRLSLDDSVLKWLPELPASWRGITIHHLLSHQSGIPDCCSGMSLQKFRKLDGLGNQQLLKHYISDDTLLFAPGTDAQYCNSNYLLLAEIIGKVSGKSYAAYLQENIFIPLGMQSSYVFGHDSIIGTSAALNYGRTNKIFGITIAFTGAVGVYSSAPDLSAFATGLLTGKLVSSDTLRLMTTKQSKVTIGGYQTSYGYGWEVPEKGAGLSVFGHSGDEDGFVSFMRINYEKGNSTILLANGGKRTARVLKDIKWIAQVTYD